MEPQRGAKIGILTALMLALPAVGGGLASAADAPLWTFNAGDGTPGWTVLALDVLAQDSEIRFQPDFSQVRCPSVTSFTLFTGEELLPRVGIAFDFEGNQEGAEVITRGPVVLSESLPKGQSNGECEEGNIGVGFMGIPEGRAYLLVYTAGMPYVGPIPMSVAQGSLRVVGSASGPETFHVGPDGFVVDGGRVWASSAVAGAEVGWQRSASVAFGARPWFFFNGGIPDVSRHSVTDPIERVWTSAAGGVMAAGTYVGPIATVNTFDIMQQASLPAGGYEFKLDANADAGTFTTGPPHWVIYGADFHLPGESRAGQQP